MLYNRISKIVFNKPSKGLDKMKVTTTKYTFYTDIHENLTFIFVSDLHGCENDPILDMIKQAKPDGVLVGGDFIHDSSVYKSGLEFLTLSSKLSPTFVALGNHEHRYDGDIRGEVVKRGATLLDNSSLNFKEINIGGLSSCEFNGTGEPDTVWLDSFAHLKGFKLLLCHRPEYYEKHIKHLPIDLTLSGHAHGGQWRFFGQGLYAPGQGILPKYTSGMHDGRFIVGRGLGNPHLVPRINNKPEIIILNVRPLNQKEI